MKVIDLLNKIANGEEVPKKITIDKGSYEFEWNGNMYIHRFRNKYGDYCDFVKPDYIHNLDKEIHIIEDTPKEDKKYIEHIKMQENELHNHLNIIDKLNEIIDKVNGEDNAKDN